MGSLRNQLNNEKGRVYNGRMNYLSRFQKVCDCQQVVELAVDIHRSASRLVR